MENSLFCRLPGELRNEIFSFLQPEPAEVTIILNRVGSQHARIPDQKDFYALAGTCKGIRAEVFGEFFNLNKFNLTLQPFYLGAQNLVASPQYARAKCITELQAWIKSVGPENVKSIRHLTITLRGELFAYDYTPENQQAKAYQETAMWIRKCLAELKAVLSDQAKIITIFHLPYWARQFPHDKKCSPLQVPWVGKARIEEFLRELQCNMVHERSASRQYREPDHEKRQDEYRNFIGESIDRIGPFLLEALA